MTKWTEDSRGDSEDVPLNVKRSTEFRVAQMRSGKRRIKDVLKRLKREAKAPSTGEEAEGNTNWEPNVSSVQAPWLTCGEVVARSTQPLKCIQEDKCFRWIRLKET